MRTYTTIFEIIKANEEAGNYFFEPSSMRFFKSKVYPEIIHGNVFITSEKHESRTTKGPRLFTVRVALSDGSIEELSQFQAFASKRQAINYAHKLPKRIQEAIECAQKEFNSGVKVGMGFVSHGLIEPTNSKSQDFSLSSFAGACTWLLINWNNIGATWLKDKAAEFEKAFDSSWLPVPTNKNAKD